MTYSKNDPETIRSMFDSIAKNYDRTNAVLSLGMHNRWNSTLINKVLVPSKPRTILDLCCGTGAISLDYLRKVKEPIKAYLLDFSGEKPITPSTCSRKGGDRFLSAPVESSLLFARCLYRALSPKQTNSKC